ncbi:MAG: hypothetical protein K0R57_2190 [Paenibacillaceae bacterium]|jgi:hyaluronate lyase|nr:hypothetical protein [Paenibacillaceae bacterium]
MEFNALIDKWRAMLTGGPASSSGVEEMPSRSKIIMKLTDKARWNQSEMVRQGGDSLWLDVSRSKDARHVHQTYLRLKEMAVAHETEGSVLYQNAELAETMRFGLQWAYDNLYNEHISFYGNWWYWEIGVPLELLDTLILLNRLLPSALTDACLRAVDRCTPSPEWMPTSMNVVPHLSTGANRVWKSRVCLLSALLKRNSQAMASSCQALEPVFEYVEEGDGFHRDGSFIQHTHFPYTGGYGKALLKELSEVTYWLKGSNWQISQEHIGRLLSWVEEAFEPLMYKGIMADMVNGREVSRSFFQNGQSGQTVLGGVLRLIEVADGKTSERLKQTAKYWLQANTRQNFLEEAPLDLAIAGWRLLNDAAAAPREDYRISKVFAAMDRVVHQVQDTAIGISMFSSRMGTYESINGENLHGWHTAHGMTYLYNNDLGQYSDGFWPTVDPYRLPGTTASSRPRADGEGSGMRSTKPFAGGAVLSGQYTAAGMELEEPGEFHARKSWFLFEDQVIALGSGIRSENPLQLETTAENRMLSREGSDTVTVGAAGQSHVLAADGTTELPADGWVHLQGAVPGTAVGYVFPRVQPVSLLQETRTGSWRDINEQGPPVDLSRRYLTIWFDHGIMPSGGEYAYVLLPGRNAEQTAAYRDNGEAEIVEMSAEAHSARIPRLGLTGILFWEDKPKKAGAVACDKKAAVVVKEDSGSLAVSVADPTMENDGFITIEIDASASGVTAKDKRIEVLALEPSIRFNVNVGGARGSSSTIVFAKVKREQ